jgi:hypothetical protein
MGRLSGLAPSRALFPCILGGLLLAPAAYAADLTGHWRDVASNGRYELAQSGTDVVMSPQSTTPCEGTITGSDVEIVCNNPSLPHSYSLVLSADELTLSGLLHTYLCVVSYCRAVDIPVTLERCECYDGNSTNGDGCDLMCEVEDCHECSGSPSTCTPLPDATTCEDPSFCVSGGTCSAGACEGGAETAQCLDLSGTWLRATRTTSEFYSGSSVTRSEFLHEADGTLKVYSLPNGRLNRSGTVDTTALTFLLDATGSFPNCGQSELDAAIEPEGNRYTATGVHMATTPRMCLGIASYEEVGVRCAPAALEPPDGCSVDSCQRCEGDPAVCEAMPDWTPCTSDDPCSVLSTCQAGECVTAVAPYCPACSTCDGAGGCVYAPRGDCRDGKTKLTLKSPENPDQRSMRWNWKEGGPVEPADIGRPDVSTRVSICVFDESEAEPALIYFDSVNDGSLDIGWTADDNGSMRFRSRTDPISSIDMRVGNSAKMSIKAGSESVGQLSPELSLPLRAQLQIDGGACFEGSYEADDVLRNANGTFKAKSAP